MDHERLTQGITAQGPRPAGSDAERRAGNLVRDALRGLGRDVDVEPIVVRPRWALAHTLHAVVGVVGSIVVVTEPIAGTAIVLAAALLALLDIGGVLQLTRRLTGERASQNVFSPGGRDRPGTLLLVCPLDAPRDSGAFRALRRIARDPWLVMLAAFGLLLVACGLRVAGLEGNGLTAAQFVPTVALIFLLPALLDVELSPGASGGATGPATAVRLAAALDGTLRHFDVWVLATGAQAPFGLGMRRWLGRHRGSLDRESTAVLCLDRIGSGGVRYSVREGPLYPLRSHTELIRLCQDMREDDADGTAFAAAPAVVREHSAGAAARARGLPSLTISTEDPDPVDPAAVERAFAFARELAERLDAEVGPRLAGDAEPDGAGLGAGQQV